jgi:hypothetical protein
LKELDDAGSVNQPGLEEINPDAATDAEASKTSAKQRLKSRSEAPRVERNS